MRIVRITAYTAILTITNPKSSFVLGYLPPHPPHYYSTLTSARRPYHHPSSRTSNINININNNNNTPLCVTTDSNNGSIEPPPPSPSPPPPSPPSSQNTPLPKIPLASRGRVNEIDFCMSPSDVSLSRLMTPSTFSNNNNDNNNDNNDNNTSNNNNNNNTTEEPSPSRPLSLTRSLNQFSNRAVRRILLIRSWPSADALNLSLRRALTDGVVVVPNIETDERDTEGVVASSVSSASGTTDTDRKCDPGGDQRTIPLPPTPTTSPTPPTPTPETQRKKRSDQEWVNDQMRFFREGYGDLPGYEYADAYLECVLSLATTGVESSRVKEVKAGGVYDDSYSRVISVLKSVGTVFEEVPIDDDDETTPPQNNEEQESMLFEEGHTNVTQTTTNDDATVTTKTRVRIAPKLLDQDICWSTLDKINIRAEKLRTGMRMPSVGEPKEVQEEGKEEEEEEEEEEVIQNDAVDESQAETEESVDEVLVEEPVVDISTDVGSSKRKRIKSAISNAVSWIRGKQIEPLDDTITATATATGSVALTTQEVTQEEEEEVKKVEEEEPKQDGNADDKAPKVAEKKAPVENEPLTGVLLSSSEPTVTRQLNVLANIVKRALLFGGDQEILVLYQTLEGDRAPFIQRWYPDTDDPSTEGAVRYFDCLVRLLKDCYEYGVLNDLASPFSLPSAYRNSYERLTALLVELGSGYVRPAAPDAATLSAAVPKTSMEEFVRFSQLEVALRRNQPQGVTDYYPDDLVGTWQVRDEIEGKVIGTSTVVFEPDGEVSVAPPLRGLRWRLDPGPTHLDTCTFQVLSEDGVILQYRGFMDRGARIESRFSKRSLKIRGSVSFRMRDGGEATRTANMMKVEGDFLLPVAMETGTTRFVMSKVFDLDQKRF